MGIYIYIYVYMHKNRAKVQKSVLKTKEGNKNIFFLFRKLSLKIPEVVKTDIQI